MIIYELPRHFLTAPACLATQVAKATLVNSSCYRQLRLPRIFLKTLAFVDNSGRQGNFCELQLFSTTQAAKAIFEQFCWGNLLPQRYWGNRLPSTGGTAAPMNLDRSLFLTVRTPRLAWLGNDRLIS